MKRTKKQTHITDEIRQLEAQLQALPRPQGAFDYTERARACTVTRKWFEAVADVYWKDYQNIPARIAIEQARARYNAAWEAAFPPGFWDSYERLRAGNADGLFGTVPFLEADPIFPRSGYVKRKVMRAIKPHMIGPEWVERLGRVVLHVVDARHDHDFRVYCQLARKVDTPPLRAELARRIADGNGDVRHRARWVLQALEQPR